MTTPPHTIIIAEAGVNHNGSLDTALEMVGRAARAGLSPQGPLSAGKLR